jgi:hypothetical protein
MPPGGSPASAPIELIDVVFALSNVRLVKEIVQDNLRQLDQLNAVGKGQTEGLKSMILQKQQQALKDLNGVEKVLIGTSRRGALHHLIKGHFQRRLEALLPAEIQVKVMDTTYGAAGGDVPTSVRRLR